MKKVLKYTAWVLAAIVVLAVAACLWAYQVATARYEKDGSRRGQGKPLRGMP
jgi:hypothetical protein